MQIYRIKGGRLAKTVRGNLTFPRLFLQSGFKNIDEYMYMFYFEALRIYIIG